MVVVVVMMTTDHWQATMPHNVSQCLPVTASLLRRAAMAGLGLVPTWPYKDVPNQLVIS